MHLHTVIFTFENQIFQDLKNRYHGEMTSFYGEGSEIYYSLQEEENAYILVFVKNIFEITDTFVFLKESFLNVGEYVIFGPCYSFGSIDIKPGDIIIPHTCIQVYKNTEERYIFLENIIGENLDFQKFGLILNGICCTIPKDILEEDKEKLEEIYGEGVYDYNIFPIIDSIKKEVSGEDYTIRVIQKVSDPQEQVKDFENLYDIFEFLK